MQTCKVLGVEENHNIGQKWERKVGVCKKIKIDFEHRVKYTK
jgi:hypothetical protein